ncbi:MAG: hypothetical protein V1729_00490 [Candidatus Woesearchaeota archaeon]
MAIDEETRKILSEVMGPNVLRQLTTAVPDFFDDKYLITKLVEKPLDQQMRGYPLAKLLEPETVASTHPGCPPGTIIDVDVLLPELMDDGYNVSLSPTRIRAYMTDDNTLEMGPIDSLVIAQFPKTGKSFEDVQVFYRNGARLYGGKSIGYGPLNRSKYFEGSGRLNVHFAFTPQKEEERRTCAFIQDHSWQLIRSETNKTR